VYRALTRMPEDPNGVYLARENAGKPDGVNFCFHRGCTRWLTTAGSAVQTAQAVDCATGQLSPTAAPKGEEILYNLVCLQAGRAQPLALIAPNFVGISRVRSEALAIIQSGRRLNFPPRTCIISVFGSGAFVERVT